MQIFSDAMSLSLFDGVACALLAAAAACRARGLGAHFTGAIVLGCLCGLIGPLLREAFLHGQDGARQIASSMPDDALIGAMGAFLAIYLVQNTRFRLFFWLDAASIGLACAVGSIYALEIGMVGAICLGLINGLAPGLVRDIALGDTAMLVDKDWYATAAALGSIVSIAVFIALNFRMIGDGGLDDLEVKRAGEIAALAGFLVVCGLRAWKGRPGSDSA